MHNFMVWFVRACALYNLSGVLTFLVPGGLELAGVPRPPSPFWVWLPALLGFFAAVVLYLSSFDLKRYGAFPYWNGLVRLTYAVTTFALRFSATIGPFANILAAGDVVLALGTIFGVPLAAGRTHAALLTNR